jgi:uncharacterized phage-associated protein
MPYDQESAVADYLLTQAREAGELLTNLKLQKLLYYAQAWHLALRDRELFSEDFRAWVHGPVLLSQYHRFKDFKWASITAEIEPPDLSGELTEHLDMILEVFGPETAIALEQMTHAEKPWLEARGDLAPFEPSSAVISKATMKDFYRALSEKSDGDQKDQA